MSEERTFIAIKPDGVQRGLVSQVLARFESRGYKLVGIKVIKPTKDLLHKHYAEHVEKSFFPKLISYMMSGPIVATVWEGKDVILQGRAILGATNPLKSAPGTIRGDFAIDMGRNVCHGSDSVESANREINLWFKKEELIDWESTNAPWIYE
ncbi:HDR130Cp [Eremothecium sinecaudum]|uniref:Nucleoside diphosphate kinase n=1 Tax=Eremothecium sinecaudum TaxID=45286 RepID=A0A0X8HSU1_9SACH|nr:HDR130Cp [Eremothecium sinecaudum]AMD20872.1 HDR130Cp [Eremothecium sinecaudum]